ncbi:hypothetical protein ACRAWF_02695 [Streptomyces sp. L7]
MCNDSGPQEQPSTTPRARAAGLRRLGPRRSPASASTTSPTSAGSTWTSGRPSTHVPEIARRIALICEAYGLDDTGRLVDTVLWWQDRRRRGIEAGAERGERAMARPACERCRGGEIRPHATGWPRTAVSWALPGLRRTCRSRGSASVLTCR